MPSKQKIYRQKYNEDDLPGYYAISSKTKEIYGSQESTHWATIIPYELGGKDPLWAIDCFVSNKQQEHFHFISAGFSNLYFDDEHCDEEFSGFGFEITFRYDPLPEDMEKPSWPANFFQNIARYVFKSEKGFDEYHYMSANGPIRSETATEITAFAFCIDSEMGTIDTPHGKVKFLQLFGLTTKEYTSVRNKEYTIKELLEKHLINNPLLITDLNRK